MVSATSQTLRIMNPTKSVFLLNVRTWHTESVGVRVGMWSDVIALRHMTGGHSVLGVDDDDSDVLLMLLMSNSASHANEFDFGETRPPPHPPVSVFMGRLPHSCSPVVQLVCKLTFVNLF